MIPNTLQAPFPWFGGKSRVAPLVWQRFGQVKNYVEPFFGSGAVLLGAPEPANIETVNDLDGFVANFWRALAADPEAVAHHADWPVNENDLTARHAWLVREHLPTLARRLESDPDYYDAKVAGWWVWGICCWIGGGWCSGSGPWQIGEDGLLTKGTAGKGVARQLPHLGGAGQGVNRKLPHLGDAGQGIKRKTAALSDWFGALADRLLRVRVCCGDWERVCGPSVTFKHGLTGVFLDPPYDESIRAECYAVETVGVATRVRQWCLDNGSNPLLRIALCGYDGEHNALESHGWDVVSWKTKGGYGSQGDQRGRDNAHKERIWFSPACIQPEQVNLL